MHWENGIMYKGEFDNNLMNGKGIIIYGNGDFYKGEFKNNEFHGFGLFLY